MKMQIKTESERFCEPSCTKIHSSSVFVRVRYCIMQILVLHLVLGRTLSLDDVDYVAPKM